MILLILNVIFFISFLGFAYVNLNDKDAYIWVPIYTLPAILCGLAVAGTIAAAVLHQSEPDFDAGTLVVTLPPPAPLPVEFVSLAPAAPDVILTNPFDPSEKFTFPPGTSRADAREQMANLLLERAVGRKAHMSPRQRKLASDRQPTPSGRGS